MSLVSGVIPTFDRAVRVQRGPYPRQAASPLRVNAHGWLGEELLEAGCRAEAAAHLRTAIRGRHPIRPGALYPLTRLPDGFSEAVRRGLGRVTRPFRHRRAG